MKLSSPMRLRGSRATIYLAFAVFVCAQAAQGQNQWQNVNRGGPPAPGRYGQSYPQPTSPRSGVGRFPAGNPGTFYGQSGYGQSRLNPGQTQGGAQPGSLPPQTSGYGSRAYAPGNGYGQFRTNAQSPDPSSPQSVPNRNANYSGSNPQMRQNPQQRFWQQQPGGMGPNAARGEHLQQWMERHNNLNSQDQQRALEREPGFNQMPQQTQQRMLNRLQRLNSMPPEQRERVLQRSEQMERLSPTQRGEVRSAMGELGALPQDRRRAVAHSFRELRPLPPEQRNQLLNSPGYRQQFTDQERNTLNNLLAVSPILPQQ